MLRFGAKFLRLTVRVSDGSITIVRYCEHNSDSFGPLKKLESRMKPGDTVVVGINPDSAIAGPISRQLYSCNIKYDSTAEQVEKYKPCCKYDDQQYGYQ